MVGLLKRIFNESMILFFSNETDLVKSNVNERCLCGRLAIHLTDKLREYNFNNYFVDTEYNRKQQGGVKTIINDQFRVININCDLIVHSRGGEIRDDNLIAIEMKKSTRPFKEKLKDKERLIAMTKESYDDIWSNDGRVHPEHVCGYKVGFYIEIDIRDQSYLIEFYEQGRMIDQESSQF